MSAVLQHAADMTPRRIGKYEVLGELGHGGMAVVYRAHDPRLERDVAVKVLHPHLARDAQSRGRFAREARAAARLRHPNIVEVYEFSEEADDQSYMVTELLEGPTLRRFAELHPDPCAEVVAAIGVVLCDALAHAHKQGVIHRDVKPDNLMLQSGGVLKLTDFGIAHVADNREMTATGQVLGSPAHMAPEQIEGEAVDARTDLFAAATVLYALACGRLPFDGPNAHALLRKILDGDYPDPLRVKPTVGHRFAAILKRGLEREPARRYPDAAAMRADLMAFLADVGWTLPDRELQRYFQDPDAVVASLRETLRARLPALGQDAMRRGDIGAAMGYFNRALAFDPGNLKVVSLVRGMARRRQLARTLKGVAIVTAAAASTAAIVLAALPSMRRAPARPPSVAAPPAVTPAPAPPEAAARVEAPLPAPPAPTAVDDVPGVETARAPAPRTPPQRPRLNARDAAGHTAPAEVPTREVALVMRNCNQVMYSVNGGPREQWVQGRVIRLPVGRSAHFEFEPRLPGFERVVKDEMILPGNGGAPQTVSVFFLRERPDSSTASVLDASARFN